MDLLEYEKLIDETKAFATKLQSALETPTRKIVVTTKGSSLNHPNPVTTIRLEIALPKYGIVRSIGHSPGHLATVTVRTREGSYVYSARRLARLDLQLNVPYVYGSKIKRTVLWKNLTDKSLQSVVGRIAEVEQMLTQKNELERERVANEEANAKYANELYSILRRNAPSGMKVKSVQLSTILIAHKSGKFELQVGTRSDRKQLRLRLTPRTQFLYEMTLDVAYDAARIIELLTRVERVLEIASAEDSRY